MVNNNPVLSMPIRELRASREFTEMAELNHFENLGQMLAIPVTELDKLPMFGQEMMSELLDLIWNFSEMINKRTEKNHPVLSKPICELNASREFTEMAELNHFENLGQMVIIPVPELEKLPMFGQRMLAELLGFLDNYGLVLLLKEY